MASKTVVVEITDGSKQTLPLHGPFGDKALHGSKLVTFFRKSDPTKRNPPEEYKDVYRHSDGTDYWAVQCWVPANAAEVKKFAEAKPDTLIDLVSGALCTDAGQKSWREVRGNGALNLWVSFNGAPPSFMPKTAVDALKAAGHKVVEMERKKK